MTKLLYDYFFGCLEEFHAILILRGVPIIRSAVLSVGDMNNKVLSVIAISLTIFLSLN